MHVVNEDCEYLARLIHNIGIELHTTAVCTQLRRIRYGHFTLTHALLQKHWNADFICGNIDYCRPLLSQDRLKSRSEIGPGEDVTKEHTALLEEENYEMLPS